MDLSVEKSDDGSVEVNINAEHINLNTEESEDQEEGRQQDSLLEAFESLDPHLQEGAGQIMNWLLDRGGCLDSEAAFIKRSVEGQNFFRANKQWAEEEHKALIYMAEQNLSIKAMSQRLGRSVDAISLQINNLNSTGYNIKAGSRDWYRRHGEEWSEKEEEIARDLLTLQSHSEGVRWDQEKIAFLLGRSCSALADKEPRTQKQDDKHNTSWSPLERGRLLYHKGKGRGNDQISRKLGRSKAAVATQFSFLNKIKPNGFLDKLEKLGRQYEEQGVRPDPEVSSRLEDRTKQLARNK